MKNIVSLAVLAMVLAACDPMGTAPVGGYGTEGFDEETLAEVGDVSLNDAYLLQAAPKYYVGSAYKVEDVQYIPAEDLNYNQTGIAGIIPSELNGTKTSNGETFDAQTLSATSKTLPLPTIARITNLDNGSSVIVRINNRGPFVNTRILDLSPAAAKKIGIAGTGRVQIQVMAEQSVAVKNATLGGAPVVETAADANASAAAAGEYSVQVAAFYAEDSAITLAQKMQKYGNATVVSEGDMYKVRIIGLDAAGARNAIDSLRTSEGMSPGLLQNGKWINADSI